MNRYPLAFVLLTAIAVGPNVFGQAGRLVSSRSAAWPMSRATKPLNPITATFGPSRLDDSEAYIFHRGLDIPAPFGTPVYAVASGEVRLSGDYDYYTGKVVQIRHYKPGSKDSCTNGGCYYTNYMFLSKVAVPVGQVVRRGQLIGYSGAREDGGSEAKPHLHFEVRDGGVYQRHCVHPLSLLPYRNEVAPAIEISKIKTSKSKGPSVTVTVQLPPEELDLRAVRLTAFAEESTGNNAPLLSKTYDMLALNQRMSPHKSPNYVLSKSDVDGIIARPAVFNEASEVYHLDLVFHDLKELANHEKLRFQAEAIDIHQNRKSTQKDWARND